MVTKFFKCQSCGHKETFNCGLAMLAPIEEWNEEERILEEFKSDVLNGKYGEKLKAYAEFMKDDIYYDTNETIFQCLKCLKLSVHRKKEIRAFSRFTSNYWQTTVIKQSCPDCNESILFSELEHMYPTCPKCRNTMEMTGFARD